MQNLRWRIAAILDLTVLGSLTVLLVPAAFAGWVSFWAPVATLVVGAGASAVCLYQAHHCS